jgi:Putative cyclase
VTPFVTPPHWEAVTRFVELSWVSQDPRRLPGGPPHACLTAPSPPWEREARGRPFRLAAVAGLPGLVVDAVVPPYRLVVAPAARDVRDRAVLIRTGWDRRRASERDLPCGPYLDEATVDALLAGGAALVGVDFPSVNGPRDCASAARRRLLRAGIVVVEGLCNLSALPIEGFRFFAVPLLAGRSRVRAFAELLPP